MDPVERMDRYSGWLIYFLVIFTPWAFGTTQTWSIWTANVACYLLGGLWVAKWWVRRGEREAGAVAAEGSPAWSTRILAIVSVLFVALVVVSILNARAEFDPRTKDLVYLRESIRWLPHSYDRSATLGFLAQYVGLIFAFWAVRGWLRGGSNDAGASVNPRTAKLGGPPSAVRGWEVPVRTRRLLWLLCGNAAALAIVCFLQRAGHTSDLLWLIKSRSGKPPESVFGPWSYRSNAAQYFNLVWPVCVGFWLWLQEAAYRSVDRKVARFDGPQLLLVPCAILIAAAPILSGSRASALITALLAVGTLVLLLGLSRQEVRAPLRNAAAAVIVAAALIGGVIGGALLRERFSKVDIRHPIEESPVGNEHFTLVVRVRVPERLPDYYYPIVSLAPGGERWWVGANLFRLGYRRDGALEAILRGSSASNSVVLAYSGFTERFAGRTVDLAIVRSDALRLVVNGTVLKPDGKDIEFSKVPAFVNNRFLEVEDGGVREVVLAGGVIDGHALQSTTNDHLSTMARSWRDRSTLSLAGLERDSVVAGSSGVLISRPGDSGLRVTRSDDAGHLALRWPLPSTFQFTSKRVELRLGVKDLGDLPWTFFVSVAGGPKVAVTRQTGIQEDGVVSCLVGQDPSKSVDLEVIAEDTGRLETIPAGAGFSLTEMRISPLGGVSHWEFKRTLTPTTLRMRLSGRPEIEVNARRMAAEHRMWGIGAGAFQNLYELYRAPHESPAAYAHDDWLELRITLGTVGLVLVLTALTVLAVRGIGARNTRSPWIVVGLFWVGLGGCLLNGIVDLPYRVYSVFFLFVLIASLVSVLAEGGAPAGFGRKSRGEGVPGSS